MVTFLFSTTHNIDAGTYMSGVYLKSVSDRLDDVNLLLRCVALRCRKGASVYG
jgi:hypothetical protein